MADLGSTPNLTTLSGFGDSRVLPGDEIYVVSEDADFVYRIPPPTFVADGVNSVKAINIAGTWMRRVSVDFLVQTAWFVDPTNGNDANAGDTAGTALRTDAERQRRWGTRTQIIQPTTLTYLGSPPSTDPVNFDVSYAVGASLSIVGVPTVTNANIAITAVTPLNKAANPPVPWDITGVGLGATDVGRIVTINAGARLNNYAVIEKDLGGGQVRISPFGNLDIAAAVTTANPWAPVTPVIADTVDVATVPIITIGTAVFRGSTSAIFSSGPPVTNCVLFDSIQIDGTGASAISIIGAIYSLGGNIFLRRCLLRNMAIRGGGGFWMAGGAVVGLARLEGEWSLNGGPFCLLMAIGTVIAGGGILTVNRGASVAIDGDALFQNFGLFVYGHAVVASVGFFDRASANLTFQVLPGGVARSRTFTSAFTPLIYGDANAGVGILILSGGALSYAPNKPTINTAQGAGRQSQIGGTSKDWAAVPFVEPANNAMIVVDT